VAFRAGQGGVRYASRVGNLGRVGLAERALATGSSRSRYRDTRFDREPRVCAGRIPVPSIWSRWGCSDAPSA
jgi:hypothetical protein